MRKYRTTAASNDASTLISNQVAYASNTKTGQYVVVNEPNTTRPVADLIRVIAENDLGGGTLSLAGALPVTPESGWDFEIWAEAYPPDAINGLVNLALGDAELRAYEPVVADTLYLGPYDRTLTVPDGFEWLSRLQVLQWRDTLELSRNGATWPAEAPLDRDSFPTEMRVLPANTHIDVRLEPDVYLGRWTHLVVVGYNLGAAGMRMGLALDALEIVDFPEWQRTGWFHLEVPVSSRSTTDTFVLWANGAVAVEEVWLQDERTERWVETRFDIFPGTGMLGFGPPEGRRIRLLGGKKFDQFTSDRDIAKVSPNFLINQATGLALMGRSAREGDIDLAAPWFARARTWFNTLPTLGERRLVR